MINELRYHGDRAMVWDPINVDREFLLDTLRSGRQAHVVLEPGDCSRYDLLVTWLPTLSNEHGFGVFRLAADDAKDGLLVTRVRGGQIVGTALVGWFNHGGVRAIADGNEWSAEFFDWWCSELIGLLAPEPKSVGAT